MQWCALPVKKRVQYFISRAVKHFRRGEIEEEKFGEKWTIYFPKKWQQANDFSSWNLRHWTQVRLPHSEKEPANPILSHVKHLLVNKEATIGRILWGKHYSNPQAGGTWRNLVNQVFACKVDWKSKYFRPVVFNLLGVAGYNSVTWVGTSFVWLHIKKKHCKRYMCTIYPNTLRPTYTHIKTGCAGEEANSFRQDKQDYIKQNQKKKKIAF